MKPGLEERRFVAVPPGATWAELKVRSSETDTPKVSAAGGRAGGRAGALHARLPWHAGNRLGTGSASRSKPCKRWRASPSAALSGALPWRNPYLLHLQCHLTCPSAPPPPSEVHAARHGSAATHPLLRDRVALVHAAVGAPGKCCCASCCDDERGLTAQAAAAAPHRYAFAAVLPCCPAPQLPPGCPPRLCLPQPLPPCSPPPPPPPRAVLQETAAAFPVTAGTTLELTLAQFWSSLGEASLHAELFFHGVAVTPAKVGTCICMHMYACKQKNTSAGPQCAPHVDAAAPPAPRRSPPDLHGRGRAVPRRRLQPCFPAPPPRSPPTPPPRPGRPQPHHSAPVAPDPCRATPCTSTAPAPRPRCLWRRHCAGRRLSRRWVDRPCVCVCAAPHVPARLLPRTKCSQVLQTKHWVGVCEESLLLVETPLRREEVEPQAATQTSASCLHLLRPSRGPAHSFAPAGATNSLQLMLQSPLPVLLACAPRATDPPPPPPTHTHTTTTTTKPSLPVGQAGHPADPPPPRQSRAGPPVCRARRAVGRTAQPLPRPHLQAQPGRGGQGGAHAAGAQPVGGRAGGERRWVGGWVGGRVGGWVGG